MTKLYLRVYTILGSLRFIYGSLTLSRIHTALILRLQFFASRTDTHRHTRNVRVVPWKGSLCKK